jgi:hypothetical protein
MKAMTRSTSFERRSSSVAKKTTAPSGSHWPARVAVLPLELGDAGLVLARRASSSATVELGWLSQARRDSTPIPRCLAIRGHRTELPATSQRSLVINSARGVL